MLGFGKKNQSPSSRDMAVGRLKMVLPADRVDGASQMLEMMKKDMLEVIRKYVEIDENDFDIQICPPSGGNDSPDSRIKADIPIKNVRRRR
ncbi:MAG: cell division topological specificity factor MinE [Defluviitaleaceae bacterium]|nr:cell division topological specificity factor MinE [Defluviitaleaceae bacterium]